MDNNVKEQLRSNNPDFMELEKMHLEYENQLQELSQMPFLTTDLQLKEKEIKKLKLKLKDKMQKMLDEYQKCSKAND
jgi:uncharacterized protein YdcH (DUF465 family)